MTGMKKSRPNTRVVRSIEGKPTTGEFFVKTLIQGNHIALLEVRVEPGVSSAFHVHSHESVIHVIRGKLRTTVDGEVHTLGPGKTCRHPGGVRHKVEALEETLFLEIKSPVPDLGEVLGP